MPVRHPAGHLSQNVRAVFEQIAINDDIGHPPRAIRALMERGLIIVAGRREIGRDRFGKITIPIYVVPLSVHMQWCDWCAENVKEPIETIQQTTRPSGRGN